LINHKMQKKEITKAQWVKKFCSHTIKNIASRTTIWQDAVFTPRFADWDRILAKFDQEWKHVWTYVHYDFGNQKWTTPLNPRGFGMENPQSFCVNAMSHAREALESLIKRLDKSRL